LILLVLEFRGLVLSIVLFPKRQLLIRYAKRDEKFAYNKGTPSVSSLVMMAFALAERQHHHRSPSRQSDCCVRADAGSYQRNLSEVH
jgi:hypothetical protein